MQRLRQAAENVRELTESGQWEPGKLLGELQAALPGSSAAHRMGEVRDDWNTRAHGSREELRRLADTLDDAARWFGAQDEACGERLGSRDESAASTVAGLDR